jgi:hypothetical protein
MHSFMRVFSLTLLAPFVIAFPAADPARPAAGGVSFTSLDVDLEGGGCQPGDASVSIARDNSAMTIIFDKFQAADGPKAGKTKSRAFCRVTIGINSPGWAFDISSADFRGYVNIETGVEASLVSRWKWVDASGVDLKGKVSDQVQRLRTLRLSNLASRATSTKSLKARSRMMSFFTRMESYLVKKQRYARKRTRRSRSVCLRR